jgi:hypothetical protein
MTGLIFMLIPVTYWTVITLTSLPIVCYLVVLPGFCKNKKMKLLVVLTLMLMISQVLFIIFVVLGVLVYNTSVDDLSNAQRIKVLQGFQFTLLGLYDILYCVAHWIFAMKYWVIAC